MFYFDGSHGHSDRTLVGLCFCARGDEAVASDDRSPSAVDKRLGERVRTRRLEIGMSQERLAELLGVTFQQVQKYEKGVNRIAASRLLDISGALDMPIAQLFEGLSKGAKMPAPKRSLEAALNVAGAVDLVLSFAEIKDAKLRRRVLGMVKAMIDEA